MDNLETVDKNKIPVCDILGVAIAAINMQWLLDFTQNNIKALAGEYICVSNVHTTVMAFEDPQYMAIQNGAVMAIPDGGPLSGLGRKRGYADMARITGPDYLQQILMLSAEKGYRHFFYGSDQQTLDKMKSNLTQRYPGLQIVGMVSPPFRSLTEQEDAEMIRVINAARPDFIWVGLGAPKQEKWMADHRGKVNGLMVGVGAAFDYLAENIYRAPQWMQKANLEWLYRLCQEPKRLFKRYFVTNLKFIWYAVIRGK